METKITQTSGKHGKSRRIFNRISRVQPIFAKQSDANERKAGEKPKAYSGKHIPAHPLLRKTRGDGCAGECGSHRRGRRHGRSSRFSCHCDSFRAPADGAAEWPEVNRRARRRPDRAPGCRHSRPDPACGLSPRSLGVRVPRARCRRCPPSCGCRRQGAGGRA